MKLLGDVLAWTDRFITVDDRFLERIAAVWPDTIAALPAQPEEDEITISLVGQLSKDSSVRRICHWVGISSSHSGCLRMGPGSAKVGST